MSRNAFAAVALVAIVVVGALAMRLAILPPTTSTTPVGVPVTTSPVASSAPSMSPAPSIPIGVQAPGTIVFGRHGRTTDLFAIAPDGTSQVPLSTRDTCCLSLSPDGRMFAYATDIGGRLTPGFGDLDGSYSEPTWTWGPGSGAVGEIDTNRLDLAPGAVSQQGDVAFEGWDKQQPNRTGIYASIANGGGAAIGELKRLTTNPGLLHDVPIGFSPDGSKLLFVRDQDPADAISGDLYVIAVDGSGLRRLSPASTRVVVSDSFGPGASWSPDGRQVTFAGFDAAKTDGTSSVYVVDTAAGAAKSITEPGSWSTSARWSPDGTWIAFDRGMPDNKHDVFLVHPDGSGLKDITTGFDVGVCCGHWSPDGNWLVVQGSLTGRDDQTDLFVVSTVNSSYARLTQQPGDYLDWVDWVSAPVPSPPSPAP